jgi:hypothetical protein
MTKPPLDRNDAPPGFRAEHQLSRSCPCKGYDFNTNDGHPCTANWPCRKELRADGCMAIFKEIEQ